MGITALNQRTGSYEELSEETDIEQEGVCKGVKNTCNVWNDTFCHNKAFRSVGWLSAIVTAVAGAGALGSFYQASLSKQLEENEGIDAHSDTLTRLGIASVSIASLGAIGCVISCLVNGYILYKGDFEGRPVRKAQADEKFFTEFRASLNSTSNLVELCAQYDASGLSAGYGATLVTEEDLTIGSYQAPVTTVSDEGLIMYKRLLINAFTECRPHALHRLMDYIGVNTRYMDLDNPRRFAFLDGYSAEAVVRALDYAKTVSLPDEVQCAIEEELPEPSDQLAMKLLYLLESNAVAIGKFDSYAESSTRPYVDHVTIEVDVEEASTAKKA